MDMTQMQQPASQEAAEPQDGAEQGERSGTSVELFISTDGTLTLSVEEGDAEGSEEGAAKDIPMKSLDMALQAIKQVATEIMSKNSPDQAQEDQAYQAEMKGNQ